MVDLLLAGVLLRDVGLVGFALIFENALDVMDGHLIKVGLVEVGVRLVTRKDQPPLVALELVHVLLSRVPLVLRLVVVLGLVVLEARLAEFLGHALEVSSFVDVFVLALAKERLLPLRVLVLARGLVFSTLSPIEGVGPLLAAHLLIKELGSTSVPASVLPLDHPLLEEPLALAIKLMVLGKVLPVSILHLILILVIPVPVAALRLPVPFPVPLPGVPPLRPLLLPLPQVALLPLPHLLVVHLLEYRLALALVLLEVLHLLHVLHDVHLGLLPEHRRDYVVSRQQLRPMGVERELLVVFVVPVPGAVPDFALLLLR